MLDGVRPAWKSAKKHHDQMHDLYRQQMFTEAAAQCKLIRRNFDGRLEGYYDMWIERCEFMATQDLPEDWDGVFRSDIEVALAFRYSSILSHTPS